MKAPKDEHQWSYPGNCWAIFSCPIYHVSTVYVVGPVSNAQKMLPGKFATASFNIEGTVIIN